MAGINQILQKFNKIPLAFLPTPLQFAENLTKKLNGPRIYFKRDDCTGLAFGGNKTRKLEYIMHDVLEKESDVVITIGGLQSNWVRQVAAAAKKVGLDVVLILNGEKPKEYQGNLLLDSILGCDIVFEPYTDEEEQMEQSGQNPITGKIAKKLREEGRTPYIIPLGGFTPLGNLGYINAIQELGKQSEIMKIQIDNIVSAVGTGGTQSGIELGLRLCEMDVKHYGISISRHIKPKSLEIADLCNQTIDKLKLKCEKFISDDIEVNYDYIGAGYAIPTDECIEAIFSVAQTEGIILDPVYSGKAMAGLIDLVKKKKFIKEETVVFLHTGGQTGNFSYNHFFKSV